MGEIVQDVAPVADGLRAVKARLEDFGRAVMAGAVNRSVQTANGGLYLRGLLEQGPRKSLEPICERLGAEADYQSVQQFLAVSPWDAAVVLRNVAERVLAVIGVEAWVLDDTGFVKDAERSPGVKRQYSGTLGKIGNCQLGVSLHAVGERGTLPLGWALYLPEEWCADMQRRRRARIPDDVQFQTKPQLGVDLVEQASTGGWMGRRCSETRHTATTPRSGSVCTAPAVSTCSPSAPRRPSTRPRRRSRWRRAPAAEVVRRAGRAPTATPRRSRR